MPGTPDIVLPKHKYAIQVRGCFWHAHDCKRSHKPDSNQTYWTPKLRRNVERDKASDKALEDLGWRLRVVWECEIASSISLDRIADEIAREITARGAL